MWAGAIAGPHMMQVRWELHHPLYSPGTRYSLRASSRPKHTRKRHLVTRPPDYTGLARTAPYIAPRRAIVNAAPRRRPAAPGATRGSRTAGGRTSCAPRAAVSARAGLPPQARRAARGARGAAPVREHELQRLAVQVPRERPAAQQVQLVRGHVLRARARASARARPRLPGARPGAPTLGSAHGRRAWRA